MLETIIDLQFYIKRFFNGFFHDNLSLMEFLATYLFITDPIYIHTNTYVFTASCGQSPEYGKNSTQ